MRFGIRDMAAFARCAEFLGGRPHFSTPLFLQLDMSLLC
jgi:hypothetical protein